MPLTIILWNEQNYLFKKRATGKLAMARTHPLLSRLLLYCFNSLLYFQSSTSQLASFKYLWTFEIHRTGWTRMQLSCHPWQKTTDAGKNARRCAHWSSRVNAVGAMVRIKVAAIAVVTDNLPWNDRSTVTVKAWKKGVLIVLLLDWLIWRVIKDDNAKRRKDEVDEGDREVDEARKKRWHSDSCEWRTTIYMCVNRVRM